MKAVADMEHSEIAALPQAEQDAYWRLDSDIANGRVSPATSLIDLTPAQLAEHYTPSVEIVGGQHEFTVKVGGRPIANVWHSDRGVWTVETIDGPVFRKPTRQAAIDFAATLR